MNSEFMEMIERLYMRSWMRKIINGACNGDGHQKSLKVERKFICVEALMKARGHFTNAMKREELGAIEHNGHCSFIPPSCYEPE